MATAEKLKLVSVEDYLAGEVNSRVKHEYLGGYIYAMAGGTNAHNRIATNLIVQLGARLQGQSCQPYNSDTKIRVQFSTHTRFYYPDVSVICESNPPDETFQDRPVVIVEVVSRATRRSDETEKKEAYLTIPSLKAYLLVEQESAAIVLHQRTNEGFEVEAHSGLEAEISLPEVGVALLLSEIYSGVKFTPEQPDAIES